MAQENLLLSRTFLASSDTNNLSAALDQFIFVHASSADRRVSQAYAADRTIGIQQGTAKKDTGVNVGMIGISKLRLGGTVTFGQLIRSDALGEGVRHLGLGWVSAMALQSGVDGDVIEALIMHSDASGA